ncbi:Uncharacterized protein TCM_035008 [Theobroma cacao]|uniref:Uncharacterized protein n=1 Tax=Theobroma cacao TaxID=3641 RepID=A0A061FHL9_THECC|nr:Uncharacterized protein TCM_035008 [Theobroma cacao]
MPCNRKIQHASQDKSIKMVTSISTLVSQNRKISSMFPTLRSSFGLLLFLIKYILLFLQTCISPLILLFLDEI